MATDQDGIYQLSESLRLEFVDDFRDRLEKMRVCLRDVQEGTLDPNSGFQEFDQNLILINLNDALSIFDKTKKDINLEIYLKKPLEADYLKKEIKLSNDNYFIFSWGDLNKSFFGALKVERNVMFIILTLIILVAAFNIISSMIMLVRDKETSISILRTIGISENSILRIFIIVGSSIGFIGTIIGFTIGLLFTINIKKIQSLLESITGTELFAAEIYFLSKLPAEIDFYEVGLVILFALVLSVLATIYPAWRASRIDPIKVLRHA